MIKLYSLLLTLSLFSCKMGTKDSTETIKLEDVETFNTTSIQESKFENGKRIYDEFCVTCHLPSGKGIPGTYPPLAGSDWLTTKPTESLHAIKFGLQGPIEVNGEKYNNVMTPLGLSDQEIADVYNYIRNSWGNSSEQEITAYDVSTIKK
jgi:mono/diheme cytochrome c family protein